MAQQSNAAGVLQVCADQDAGAEAAIDVMHNLFQEDEIEAVLPIDAENAYHFNHVSNYFNFHLKLLLFQQDHS